MSKYIIELNDDCNMVLQICITEHGSTYIESAYAENLEELNSDYINEHFGDLQDTAYQKGINDGSLDVKQRVEGAYKRGLEDAWEAARKLFSSMADSDIEKAFPTEWNNGGFNALINLQPQEAIEKLKAYEEKQKHDDKIEVGDEVKPYYSDIAGVVTLIDSDTIYVLWRDGSSTSTIKQKEVRKTGRHFDIASILEDMRND